MSTEVRPITNVVRSFASLPVRSEVSVSDIKTVRAKELLGLVRLARLDLPFLDMHPCRTIQVAEELKADLNDKVFWNTNVQKKTYHLLRQVWAEFMQDPRWELKLIDRVLNMAKESNFTEVEFYDAYCKHVLFSGAVISNAVKVMTLFREERIDSGLSYGDF